MALSGSIADDAELDTVLENLKSFSGAFQVDRQLNRFFAHPSIDLAKKRAAIEELCGKLGVGEGIRNLVLTLTNRKRIKFLKNITRNFEREVDKRLGQTRISVLSAHPLSQENIDSLKSSMSRILGQKILIATQVDESLIGGIQLRIGDEVADATIKNRLQKLKLTIEKEEVV